MCSQESAGAEGGEAAVRRVLEDSGRAQQSRDDVLGEARGAGGNLQFTGHPHMAEKASPLAFL